MPLDAGDAPLTVGVNSFGFGGTNAHVVLTEAPAANEASTAGLSRRTRNCLRSS